MVKLNKYQASLIYRLYVPEAANGPCIFKKSIRSPTLGSEGENPSSDLICAVIRSFKLFDKLELIKKPLAYVTRGFFEKKLYDLPLKWKLLYLVLST